MFGRATAAAAATAVLTLAFAVASAGAATPIVPSSAADVDYHTEGQIIGGNIKIRTVRAPGSGLALTVCDPDPRPAAHARPDGCAFAEPAGTGRDYVDFGRHVVDADESPNAMFTAVFDPTSRDDFDGQAGFDAGAPIFGGGFFDDEDMHVRLAPRTLDAYLAPGGDANDRWRRFCGTGIVEDLDEVEVQGPDNNPHGGPSGQAPVAPFAATEVRKFVVEVWDADFRAPSDQDGGNQDYWVIDILKPGSLFDVSTCQDVPLVAPGNTGGSANPAGTSSPGAARPPGSAGPNPRPAGVTPRSPTSTGGSLPPLVEAAVAASSTGPARVAVSGAGARGPGGCVQRSFKVSVRGANVLRVDFSLDGRRMQRVTRRDSSGLYRATVSLRGLTRTTHRISARVAFRPGSAPRVRNIPIAFRRCARAASAPAFTG